MTGPPEDVTEDHECPSPGCVVRLPPNRLACRRHWYQLPQDIRDRIWANYFPGQTLATATSLYRDTLREAVVFWEEHNAPG